MVRNTISLKNNNNNNDDDLKQNELYSSARGIIFHGNRATRSAKMTAFNRPVT